MEEGWEPRHASPAIAELRIEELARRFAGGRPFVVHERLAGGLANVNVRVSLSEPAEDVVVRIYVRDPGAARKEAALLDRFAGTLPVPTLLHAGGEEPAGDDEPLVHFVTAWVPGLPLTALLHRGDEDAHRRAGAQIGHALATLHAHAYPHMGFLEALTSPTRGDPRRVLTAPTCDA